MAVAAPHDLDEATLTDEERAHLERSRAWDAAEGGYQHQQQTRPLTLAPALQDSPVGLLSWILEKHRAWSDCGGDVSRAFSDDHLLTLASLYWFTGSIGTSLRPYFAYGSGRTAPVRRVQVPTAVAVFPHDLVHPPGAGRSAPTTSCGTRRCRAEATSRRTRSRGRWRTTSRRSCGRLAKSST